MTSLRAAARLLALAGWTGGWYLWLLVRTAARGLPGRRTDPPQAGLFGSWARVARRILGLRLVVQGPPPRPAFLLVANHLGYLDVVVLGSLLDGVFLAKSEVARWRVIGRFARAVGTLFVDRASARDLPRAVSAIEAALAGGSSVILFPEGTSSPGRTVLPFRSALLEGAARRRLPVHTASLRYATPPGSPPAAASVCWWGETMFMPHLWALLRLPRIDATVTFGAEPIADDDRKLLAHRLHGEIAAAFKPVAG